MIKMYHKLIILGFLLYLTNAQDFPTNFNKSSNDEPSHDRNNELNKENLDRNIDFLGSAVNVFDQFLTRISIEQPAPNEKLCRTRSYDINGATKIKISERPRGNCSYCCPIKSLAKYVGFHFTNKAKGGEMVYLRIIRRKGMLRSVGLNNSLPTMIYIPGFMEDKLGPSTKMLRDAYLSRKEDTNILLLDWSELIPFPWYAQAVEHAKDLGSVFANFLIFYNSTGELSISKLHVIGLSLGAHLASSIGKSLKDVQRMPRLTGLDPAFPVFSMKDPSERFSKEDADYADVIHTDGGGLGFAIPLGHADFYPNGGTAVQPGCDLGVLVEDQQVQRFAWCSHLRALQFYVESVKNPLAFPATEYDLRDMKSRFKQRRGAFDVYMGFPANKTYAVGNFFLTTNNRGPFGRSIPDQEIDLDRMNITDT